MKKKIKNAFSVICISEKVEKNILNMTIHKHSKSNGKIKVSYACGITIIMCLISLTIVYAKEIEKIIRNWSTSVALEDGTKINISENNDFKEIPSSAIKVKEDEAGLKMTYQKIEEMLGFSFLKLS